LRTPSKFIHVTCYAASPYLADFKASQTFDEGQGRPLNLDNLARRTIRPRLEATGLSWPGWYSLRRFHGTAVRAESNLETTSRALGNSKAVADRHYVKPSEVLPDVRKAVNDAVSGLTDVQPVFNDVRKSDGLTN